MGGRLWKKMPLERENNLPERMTTLTSFSSLEISELEVKGLILSLFLDLLQPPQELFCCLYFWWRRLDLERVEPPAAISYFLCLERNAAGGEIEGFLVFMSAAAMGILWLSYFGRAAAVIYKMILWM